MLRTSWFAELDVVLVQHKLLTLEQHFNLQKLYLDHFPTPKPNLTHEQSLKSEEIIRWMTLMYKQQTLIVSLNFPKIKIDWLITMLFQGQQRCWSRNMSHLVKSGSAMRAHTHTHTHHTIHACGYSVIKELGTFFNHFYMYKIFRKDPARLTTGCAERFACLTWLIDKLLKNNLSEACQLIQGCQAAVGPAVFCSEDPPAVPDDLRLALPRSSATSGCINWDDGRKVLEGDLTGFQLSNFVLIESSCAVNIRRSL